VARRKKAPVLFICARPVHLRPSCSFAPVLFIGIAAVLSLLITYFGSNSSSRNARVHDEWLHTEDCTSFTAQEFSPNDFEKLGGNGKANKWRKNITVGSVPLGDWLAACNIEYCRAMTVKVLDVDRPCTTAPPTAAVHCGEKTGLLLVYKIIIRLADGKVRGLRGGGKEGGKGKGKEERGEGRRAAVLCPVLTRLANGRVLVGVYDCAH